MGKFYTTYEIKNKKVDVQKVIDNNRGDLYLACNEISKRCLVSFETAKYYVELCDRDEPFVKENSGTSFACGILGTIAFVLSALGLGYGVIVFPLMIASIIVGIVDIATMDSEIPHKHVGAIIGFVMDVFLIFVTIFL